MSSPRPRQTPPRTPLRPPGRTPEAASIRACGNLRAFTSDCRPGSCPSQALFEPGTTTGASGSSLRPTVALKSSCTSARSPRDGSQPTAGESLTYELGRGQNGKPQAVKAWRTAVGRDAHTAPKTTRPPRRQHRSAMMIISVLLLGAVGICGYGRFEKRLDATRVAPFAAVGHSGTPDSVAIMPAQFSCDGRVHCWQMTSCAEAKFFLKNCPGTKMDGNNDGVPCEQQWCTSPFAK
jgi:hypothetical protein